MMTEELCWSIVAAVVVECGVGSCLWLMEEPTMEEELTMTME